ncbi:hypothetical protein B0H14DRAFT_3871218 [Mycena olivaceomarginata]|nr:hypothetical protein B0H14DRAFT_3871218 [Mycena olivaceomarginata]
MDGPQWLEPLWITPYSTPPAPALLKPPPLAGPIQTLQTQARASRFKSPLARVHPNNRIAFAKACIAAIPGTTKQLDAIEIGNEPDLYSLFPKAACGSPDRRAKYGPEDYAAEWKKAWYQAMTISSGNPHSWNVATTWNDIDEGGFVKTVSQHYFGATIAFLQKRDIPFVLGEVGSAILGAVLWTADFMLHSMAMGIARVSMQQGTGFNIAAWQPVTTPALPKAVHGNWYGHVFAADFIGPGGNFQIHALPTNASHPDIVSYAGYNSGLLTKLAALDMRFWEGVNDSPRPAVDIRLPDLGTGITAARVSRLTAPGGSGDLQNISWAGKQWSADDDGKEPRGNNSVVVKVVNGSLAGNVTIWASQAVLLEMIRA